LKKIKIVVVLLFMPGSTFEARAQGWEVSILGGWTAPTFEHELIFSPDIDFPDIPGGNIRQEGVFRLDARGSLAFGGSVSYFFNEHVGIEGRIDTIDFDIATSGPRFEADVDLVPPLPPATAVLELEDGAVNVERLFPLSVNLKARSGGSIRFVASGGLSYLPRVRFDAVQPVSLGISGPGISEIELARVVLKAGALADGGESRWGFNAGAGVEIDVSPNVSIVGDVRVHSFQSQTFVWQSSKNPSSELEKILLEELEKLPPIEVELLYFQATAGVAFRF